MNLIIDFGVIIVPIPILWRLQMPFPKKVGIAAMLSIGVLYVLSVNTLAQHLDKPLCSRSNLTCSICVIIILRVVYLLTLDLVDFTYSSAMLSVWDALELTLSIVNACLPLVRPAKEKLYREGLLWFKRFTEKSRSEHRRLHVSP